MGRSQVIEKLDKFLRSKKQLNTESDVLYLLIEIRKVLDHQNVSNDAKLLRFYSDWAMHITKKYITTEMKTIVKEMYEDIVKEINLGWPAGKSKVNNFTYMEELKKELKQFLDNSGLPNEIIGDKNWIEFVKQLVEVLSDQPIIKPIPEVTLINFLPTTPGFIICRIDFKEPVKGYPYYVYKNVY